MSTVPPENPAPTKAAPYLPLMQQPDAPGSFEAPPFPVLASTQFCMEVLLRGSVLDLSSLREILTFDPCALLRIFARSAEESLDPDNRPQRLDECIVALGTAGLVRALQYTPSTWQQQARLSAFADRAVRLGQCAEKLAGPLGMCQETAFLLGMLHRLAQLPFELGWHAAPSSQDDALTLTSSILQKHKLPADIEYAILSSLHGQSDSPWSLVLQAAQELAEQGNAELEFLGRSGS